jgi:hypothetical protein
MHQNRSFYFCCCFSSVGERGVNNTPYAWLLVCIAVACWNGALCAPLCRARLQEMGACATGGRLAMQVVCGCHGRSDGATCIACIQYAIAAPGFLNASACRPASPPAPPAPPACLPARLTAPSPGRLMAHAKCCMRRQLRTCMPWGPMGPIGSHCAYFLHERIMKEFKCWLRNCSAHELFVSALYICIYWGGCEGGSKEGKWGVLR